MSTSSVKSVIATTSIASLVMMMQIEIPDELLWLIFNLLIHSSFNTFIVFSKTSKLINKKISSYYLRTYLKKQKAHVSLNCNEFASAGNLNMIAWMKNTSSDISWCYYDDIIINVRYYTHTSAHVVSCYYIKNTICREAILSGHFELLQWLAKNKCYLSSDLYLAATQTNRLDIILWLYENDVAPHRDICIVAAKYNNFDILKWGRKKRCRWHKKICYHAAQNNNMEMLQWARKKGCAWNAWTCSAAASNGNLEMLMWLRSKDCPWNEWTCSFAAASGHLKIIKWAIENGCIWDSWMCRMAANNGHLDVLQWVIMCGGTWHLNDDVNTIIKNGHLSILKWANTNGNVSKEDASICSSAIKYEQIEILRWTLENNFPLPDDAMIHAIKKKNLDIAKILVEKNCKYDAYHYHLAEMNNDIEMMKWLEQNGCPTNYNFMLDDQNGDVL